MKKVTIQDIADELGVSRYTVSKAINNAGSLAEATRERILQKATEMGYKHFSYLKAHTGGAAEYQNHKKGEIALLCRKAIASTHYASLMIDRMKKAFPQYGYHLTACRVENENILQRTLPPTFDPSRVSAVICVEMFDRIYDEMICSLSMPVLFVDGPSKRDGIDLPADQLYMDNTTAITRFVNDMLARGKHRIGFIGNYEECQSLFERYTAFRCAMLMSNVPVEQRFCIKTNDPDEVGNVLAALSDFPDVFVCSHDLVASKAVYTLHELGISVPGNVLVCGFDDSPESRIMTPALTTVHIHTSVMAAAAIQLLLSRIDEPSLDYRIIHTETELIYRESTRI